MSNLKEKVKKTYNELNALAKESLDELKNKKNRKKQIPNILTASRLLSPIFIIPSALTGNILLTAIFTSLFALTDAFDGLLARKFNSTSEFGRKLDPITDKIFASSLLFPIVISNPIMTINLSLEIIIALININSQINNKNPKTNFLGKIKTCFLYSTIALSYLNSIITLIPNIINIFITCTTLLQLSAGLKYYFDYKKIDNDKIIEVKNITYNKENEIHKENEKIKSLKEYKNYLLNKKNSIDNPEYEIEKEKIYYKK